MSSKCGTTSDINNAHLTDSILRVYTAYHLTRKRIMLTTKVAYFDESQRYDDPLYGIHANYKVRSYKAEVNGKFLVLPKLDAEAGASGNIAQAEISEYKHNITDVRYSVYSVLHCQPVKGLNIKGKIQQEITKGARPPLVPILLITYSIWNNFLTLKASAGKQFNLPCLNDKYWVPGGNPNLMCETSWTGEAGYILSPMLLAYSHIGRNRKESSNNGLPGRFAGL